jgi:hypothetical protein
MLTQIKPKSIKNLDCYALLRWAERDGPIDNSITSQLIALSLATGHIIAKGLHTELGQLGTRQVIGAIHEN